MGKRPVWAEAVLVAAGVLLVGSCALDGEADGQAVSGDDQDERSAISEPVEEEDREAVIAEDVELVDCRVDEYGWMVAGLEFVNGSSERSNYRVHVAFTTPDGSRQLATAYGRASALEPGQATSDVAETAVEPTDAFTCEIIEVTRRSDE